MYEYIKGKIADVKPNRVVIETGGIGYVVQVSGNTASAIGNVGEERTVYTAMIVREDSVTLYGFLSYEERAMFERILGVSGVGPRTALGVLSVLSTTELAIALATGDANSIARAPGVGKKTAQRMILELKDKISNEDMLPNSTLQLTGDTLTADAVQALIALGYSAPEAVKAVERVRSRANKVEDVILLALQGEEVRP